MVSEPPATSVVEISGAGSGLPWIISPGPSLPVQWAHDQRGVGSFESGSQGRKTGDELVLWKEAYFRILEEKLQLPALSRFSHPSPSQL